FQRWCASTMASTTCCLGSMTAPLAGADKAGLPSGRRGAGGPRRGAPVEPVDVLHQVSGPGINWSRVNMAESVVGVQTPLSWSLWDEGGEMGFRLGYRALGLIPRSAMAIPESVDQQFT